MGFGTEGKERKGKKKISKVSRVGEVALGTGKDRDDGHGFWERGL